jgi:pyruvate/2-oxoglutarate dehydrogenase complex dihydrolipoamide dehydrogenase (E3) component
MTAQKASTPPTTALIIGAGQAGGPLAGALAKAGWDVTIVEREHVGGTCVNEGCTPTKTLIASARAAHVVRASAPLGIHAQGHTDMAQVTARVQGIINSFREGSQSSLEKSGARLVFGEASFTGPHEVSVRGQDGGSEMHSADFIFINAGARPVWPDLEGLDSVGALTSTGALQLEKVPEHLMVLGGGYISLELSQAYLRFGSRVTVIERGERLLPREDEDVVAELRRALEEEGVVFLTGHQALKVRREGEQTLLTVQNGSGETSEISGDVLLVATGRTPNTEALNLGAAGVQTDKHGHIVVDEHLHTTAGHIYALGDIKGGPAFTHISYDDYRIVRDALLKGQQRSTQGRLVPYTVFTDPQLGRVGLDSAQAEQHHAPTRIYSMPMSQVARATETGETAGLMRVVIDDASDRLLGATVLGLEGGEVMTALQLGLMGGLTAADLREATIAHPTLCEAFNTLFMTEPKRVEGKAGAAAAD